MRLFPPSLFPILVLSILGCSRSEPSPARTAEKPRASKPLPEPVTTSAPADEILPPVSTIESLLAIHRTQRFRVPGELRWAVEVPFRVVEIRPYSAGGFIVMGEREIQYFTRNGEPKWERVIGPGYRLFGESRTETVWIPARSTLMSLGWRGALHWERPVEGALFPALDGRVFLVDAAVVELLGPDGEQVWRFSSDQVHSFETPVITRTGIAIVGRRGSRRLLFFLDPAGRRLGEVALEADERLLGLTEGHRAVVSSGSRVRSVEAGGVTVWSSDLPEIRSVSMRGDDLLLLTAPSPGRRPSLLWVSDSGGTAWSSPLPEERDPLEAAVIGWPDATIWVAACLGPARGCRGPKQGNTIANELFFAAGRTGLRQLPSFGPGYFSLSGCGDGIVTARSIRDSETLVAQYDAQGNGLWQQALSGVLAAGPIVDEASRVVLVALGSGEEKALLAAFTARTPPGPGAPEGSTAGSNRSSARNAPDGGAGDTRDTTGHGTGPDTRAYPPPRAPDAGAPPG